MSLKQELWFKVDQLAILEFEAWPTIGIDQVTIIEFETEVTI